MSNQPPNNEPWQPQEGYNQPPWQQPPNTNYPPQPPPNQPYQPYQPYPQQPMPPYQQPPKKKSRLWLWIVLGIVGVLVLGCIGVSALVYSAARSVTTTTTISTLTTEVATTTNTTPAPSNTQHFAVGQVVKIDDTWNITVNSVKTSKGDQFSVPKSGNTFLIIDLSMKNISAQEQNVSSLISFNLQDNTGQKYTESLTTLSDVHPPDGKVEAGAPLRGQLVYEVPISMKTYTLSFQADFTSAGQTIWDIHV
jgi:Domain of unknown function (DUF4352)